MNDQNLDVIEAKIKQWFSRAKRAVNAIDKLQKQQARERRKLALEKEERQKKRQQHKVEMLDVDAAINHEVKAANKRIAAKAKA